ncbi:glycosyltransferase family 2 protein [Cohnella sp. GbtcB17]|uniref:glycosyltransferase family 2 protein n=1 Tax=Cohnella sp. GbtcB17 TaxID=2824762 RepID=UPI001C303749|nr:glycosyltransferase family 2 protein [Cohnella sp. GbtcB17]
MMAKVSIIIACYNKAPYIGNTFHSIINQLWDNIEVVLVDDGSTDETEEIIHEWEARFLDRGYELVVMRQHNAGVAAAIKSGLACSNGQYICFPDADDELDEEYVSSLVQALEADEDAEFAVCGLARRSTPNAMPAQMIFTDEIMPNTTIEQVLLQRVHSSVCVYLVKREYAERCGMMGMVTEDATSQEPQITTLIYAGGGKSVKVDKPLYIYNTYASELAGGRGKQFLSEHYRNRLRLYEKTIEQLSRSSEEKAWFKGLAAIGCRYMVSSIMSEGDVDNEIFFRSLTNGILNRRQEFPQLTGCIIAYGSLGHMAKRLLPLLQGTLLQPQLYWDAAADSGAVAYGGSAVTKPNEAQLGPESTLICFPKSQMILAEVKNLASSKRAKVLSWHDVIDYLAYQYYPTFGRVE